MYVFFAICLCACRIYWHGNIRRGYENERERESYFLNVLKLLYRERGVEERVVKQKVQEEFDLS